MEEIKQEKSKPKPKRGRRQKSLGDANYSNSIKILVQKIIQQKPRIWPLGHLRPVIRKLKSVKSVDLRNSEYPILQCFQYGNKYSFKNLKKVKKEALAPKYKHKNQSQHNPITVLQLKHPADHDPT